MSHIIEFFANNQQYKNGNDYFLYHKIIIIHTFWGKIEFIILINNCY